MAGTNIQEGPGVNVARIPRNGRNFEYASGEDPVLGSYILPRIVDGIQKNVMAIVVSSTVEAQPYINDALLTASTSMLPPPPPPLHPPSHVHTHATFTAEALHRQHAGD